MVYVNVQGKNTDKNGFNSEQQLCIKRIKEIAPKAKYLEIYKSYGKTGVDLVSSLGRVELSYINVAKKFDNYAHKIKNYEHIKIYLDDYSSVIGCG